MLAPHWPRAVHSSTAVRAGETAALVGHVASLTVGLSVLCGLGGAVWGAPLPLATPFPVRGRDGRWDCAWPAGPG